MRDTWLDQNRHVIFITLLLSTLGGAGIFYFRQPATDPIVITTPEIATSPTAAPTATPGRVRVYITGAVVNSDVYFLPEGSIVKDVILMAGGLTANADVEYVNQALELRDQQQIHVPRQGEANPPPAVQGGAVSALASPKRSDVAFEGTSDLININTASLEQLDTLPGIGPVIGQRIIDYREDLGSFRTIEDITEVSGIGAGTFAKIKDLITVE